MNNLAELLMQKGDAEAGLAQYRKLVEIRKRAYPQDNPETLDILVRVADWNMRMKRQEAAEPLYRQVVDVRMARLGPADPDTVSAVNRLAYILFRRDKIEEGVALLKPVVTEANSSLSPEDQELVVLHGNMGRFLMAQKKYDEAEKEVLAYYDGSCLRRDTHYITDALTTLVRLYEKWGKPEKARSYGLLLKTSTPGK
jgi:tetratricopeptide (TPR) repeat protein